ESSGPNRRVNDCEDSPKDAAGGWRACSISTITRPWPGRRARWARSPALSRLSQSSIIRGRKQSAADAPHQALRTFNESLRSLTRRLGSHCPFSVHRNGVTMTSTRKLHDLGQSLWLDNITRELLTSGTLKHYIDDLSVTGLTSNPTIFDNAIKNSAM